MNEVNDYCRCLPVDVTTISLYATQPDVRD